MPPSKSYIAAEVHGEYRTFASDQWGAIPRSGNYRAVVIHKGTIEWIGTAAETMGSLPKTDLFRGRIIEDETDSFGKVESRCWVPLSTYSGHRPHVPGGPASVDRLCPECQMMLPVSGVCDCR